MMKVDTMKLFGILNTHPIFLYCPADKCFLLNTLTSMQLPFFELTASRDDC